MRYFAILAAVSAGLLVRTGDTRAQSSPLHAVVDGTFAPFAFPKLDGGLQGFNIDLFEEVSKRLGQGITIDNASYSGLIPALEAGRYDFLATPVAATPERAQNMIFTQGYTWASSQFGIKRGSSSMKSLEDLRDKVISVNKGSSYDIWARQNEAKYGFKIQAYDAQSDAVQAVLTGQAYASLSGNAAIRYAATRLPAFQPDFVIAETRLAYAAPFRKNSIELRNHVQDAISCMKMDGSLARIAQKWFGAAPKADDLEVVVSSGYGVPGLPGYDPTPHQIVCR